MAGGGRATGDEGAAKRPAEATIEKSLPGSAAGSCGFVLSRTELEFESNNNIDGCAPGVCVRAQGAASVAVSVLGVVERVVGRENTPRV